MTQHIREAVHYVFVDGVGLGLAPLGIAGVRYALTTIDKRFTVNHERDWLRIEASQLVLDHHLPITFQKRCTSNCGMPPAAIQIVGNQHPGSVVEKL